MSSVSLSFSQTNIIHCDSLETQIDTLFLTNFEDSINFSYDYTASNSGVTGGIYVIQTAVLDDSSVIGSIDLIFPVVLGSYVFSTQNHLFDLNYVVSSVPANYTVDGNYLIYDGFQTCQIPFTIVFDGINTGLTTKTNNDNKIRLYPNPSSNHLTIENTGENTLYLKIYNLIGMQIQSNVLTEEKTDIDISSFDIGVYLFEVSDRNGRILNVEKMVKN